MPGIGDWVDLWSLMGSCPDNGEDNGESMEKCSTDLPLKNGAVLGKCGGCRDRPISLPTSCLNTSDPQTQQYELPTSRQGDSLTVTRMPSGAKKDLEPHRDDILQRTAAGESCEQIAAALRANGFDVSSKTVSRYRVNWGLRQRSQPSTKGRTYPNRKRPSGAPSTGGPTKTQAQDARKAEITLRTQQGQSADDIAAAFEAQGYHLNKGASTIWRLQTLWGLVPYDNARARGKNSKAQQAKHAAAETAPRRRQRRPKDNVAPSNPSTTLHYPSECAFGPQKRSLAPRPDTSDPSSNVPDLATDSVMDSFPQTEMNSDTSAMNLAAEVMSAEMLVDLATSTLAAANLVKELYLAQQEQRPLHGQSSIPTVEDIANAKRKVREAAAVMHDLAMPNIVEGAVT